MFQIIRDLDNANDLAKAGLLWWVGAEDGGDVDYIITACYGESTVYASHVDAGVVGIRLEE